MSVKLPQGISEEERTLRMMRDEDQWPQWPVLPLKRRKREGMPDTAYLHSGGGTTVYIGNICSRSKDDPAKPYATYEAIIADGWVVD